jgi:hypothetical protein
VKHSAVNAGQVNFTLVYAFKPHSQALTFLSVSPDGRFLITGSEDTSIFLFRILPKGQDSSTTDAIQNQTLTYCIRPMGFLGLTGVPLSVAWSPSDTDRNNTGDLKMKTKRRLVMVLRNGSLLEATTPSMDDLDNEMSYQLQPKELNLKEFAFDLTDDITRAEAIGEAACRALAEEAAKKEEEGFGDPNMPSSAYFDKERWKIFFIRKGGLGGGFLAVAAYFFDKDLCLLSVEAENGEGQLRVCNINNPKMSRLVYI